MALVPLGEHSPESLSLELLQLTVGVVDRRDVDPAKPCQVSLPLEIITLPSNPRHGPDKRRFLTKRTECF
jgi:hypothetical protein